MSKVYFKTGNVDTLINITLKVKTEKREGSSINHVVFTDEVKELADHTTHVEGVTMLIRELNPEGYASNKLNELYISSEAILALADKIRNLSGIVVNTRYDNYDNDLPF